MFEPALPIWREATDFLVPFYGLTSRFPKDELAVRINQLRADAVGMLVNLAETLNSESESDIKQFLAESRRAAEDCIAGLQIAERLNLCPPKDIESLIAQAEDIAAQLSGLLNSIGLGSKR